MRKLLFYNFLLLYLGNTPSKRGTKQLHSPDASVQYFFSISRSGSHEYFAKHRQRKEKHRPEHDPKENYKPPSLLRVL